MFVYLLYRQPVTRVAFYNDCLFECYNGCLLNGCVLDCMSVNNGCLIKWLLGTMMACYLHRHMFCPLALTNFSPEYLPDSFSIPPQCITLTFVLCFWVPNMTAKHMVYSFLPPFSSLSSLFLLFFSFLLPFYNLSSVFLLISRTNCL